MKFVALGFVLGACGGGERQPHFEGEPPGLQEGKLSGAQILIQYEGAVRRQPQVIRSKSEAKALAAELLRRLSEGEEFGALAREYSDDGPTSNVGGDLGVFEPEERIRRISRALSTMHFGEIKGPVSSRFGFHILRRDRVEFAGARQILIQHVEARNPADTVEKTRLEALAFAAEIVKQLEGGASFEELARAHSDGEEGPRGGDLGSFVRGDMIKEFEDAVWALEIGAHSGVVESIYGFHIIERTR